MITLSNGYQLPEDGDLGDIWFDALEANIQRLNEHTHNGVNSEKLDSSSIESLFSTINSGDFTLVGTEYTHQLTLPALMQVDTTSIEFRDATTSEPIYMRWEKFSVTQINIFSNAPLNLIAVFS